MKRQGCSIMMYSQHVSRPTFLFLIFFTSISFYPAQSTTNLSEQKQLQELGLRLVNSIEQLITAPAEHRSTTLTQEEHELLMQYLSVIKERFSGVAQHALAQKTPQKTFEEQYSFLLHVVPTLSATVVSLAIVVLGLTAGRKKVKWNLRNMFNFNQEVQVVDGLDSIP